jgi:predicted PurR-regulated permease PerM
MVLRRVPRSFFYAVFLLFLIVLLIRIRGVLLPFILAFVITYLFHPLVRRLIRKNFHPTAAILTIYLGMAAIMAIIGVFLVPVMINQLTGLGEALPIFTDQLQEFLNSLHENFERLRLPETVKVALEARIESVEENVGQSIASVIEGIFSSFRYALSFLLAPIFAYYLLRDVEKIKSSVINLIPEKYRIDAMYFFSDVDKAIGGYIRGQLIVVTITGTITGLTMAMLGVQFAALIGVFIAITDIIPYIGPIVGSIPAVLIALLQSPRLAVYVVASLILIQQIEANIIAPRVVSHRVGLHPIVIIFSLFVARELFGIPGMLVAVPTAATIRVFAKHIYKHFL